MKHVDLDREKEETLKKIRIKERQEEEDRERQARIAGAKDKVAPAGDETPKVKRRRFDQEPDPEPQPKPNSESKETKKKSEWDIDDTPAKPAKNDWDATPKRNRWDETPKGSQWDATPKTTSGATPTGKRSRWDQTPTGSNATPVGHNAGMATPTPEQLAQMTPKEQHEARLQHETDYRNRYLSDEDLNNMVPVEGYTVLEPPAGYAPIRTPARKLTSTPMPMDTGFVIQDGDLTAPDGFGAAIPYIPGVEGLNYFKAEDAKHFGKLMEEGDVFEMTTEEVKERKIMRLLLKIKNGQPIYRKQALRQITEGARLFGANALFNQILPLLMSPTLEDQERHLLVCASNQGQSH
jgi:splicing factor 3B subunit 1